MWVFLNGQITYVDKNLQGRPIAKEPDGRLSIENTSFVLPLKKGSNELLIGVANYFFAWGVIARMETMDDIEISPDPVFDSRFVPVAQNVLDTYIGTYQHAQRKKYAGSERGQCAENFRREFYYSVDLSSAENKFFMRDFDLQLEFVKDATNKVSECVLYNSTRQIMQVKRVQ